MSDIKVSFSVDTDNKVIVQQTQDVTEILDYNKRMQAENVGKRFGDMAHVARIPASIVMEWKQKYGIDVMAPSPEDKARMLALLNDPDYAFLRTRGGKL
jgi:hypothetical protein